MDSERNTDDLAALFEAARPVPVPDDLTGRVLNDARQVQDGFATPVAAPARPGIWTQIRRALGGWAGLGGLATACAAGVWLGFAPPAGWFDPASVLLQTQGGFDLFQGEDVIALLDVEDS